MRSFLAAMLVSVCTTYAGATQAAAQARYEVHAIELPIRQLRVRAKLPIDGDRLETASSWSMDVPGVDTKGWPALIRNLEVRDESGLSIAFTPNGDSGWRLAEKRKGSITLSYELDLSEVAKANWPAPREAFFADEHHLSMIGRSLFVVTRQTESSRLRFTLPEGWSPIAPWRQARGSGREFESKSKEDLWDNLIVLSNLRPEVVSVRGFQVRIVPMGYWNAVRTQASKIMHGVLKEYISLTGMGRGDVYTAVLLPIPEGGAESYRNSFAYNGEEAPILNNRGQWARLIAHELFHYWNGWRIKGADYPSSQWFQEGFTDYAADRALTGSGVFTGRDLLARLSHYVERYLMLQTPPAKPGNRKGPPLYSAGALAAFCWDAKIRERTGGRKNLRQFWAEFVRATERGAKLYDWGTLRTALDKVAAWDWDAFHQRYIVGTEKLPVAEALAYFGLKLEGASQIVEDLNAPAEAKRRWLEYCRG